MSKNQWKALALTLAGILTSLLLFLGTVLMPPIASAQITSVFQFSDVRPDDWYFPALQSMVERWGLYSGFADGTFRPNYPETRGGVAVLIDGSLGRISELMTAGMSDLATQEDLQQLQSSLQELQDSVQELHSQLR